MSEAPYVVIMAGGRGSRLWPLSRPERPKQFLALTGEATMLQVTWTRALQLTTPDRVLVVGGVEHRGLYEAQLPELPPANLLLEPRGCNTAPCIAFAARNVHRRTADGVMLVLSADHVILNENEWKAAMRQAAVHAGASDRLVTIGIEPEQPETRFGYMVCGPRLVEGTHPVYAVDRFVEKPDEETLRGLMASGTCLRNMGMFAWRARVLLEEVKAHVPGVHAAFELYARAIGTETQASALHTAYAASPSISIDHGVLQRSNRVSVVQSRIRRVDVGDFSAFASLWPMDEAGNAVKGTYIGLESARNIVYSDHLRVTTIGVEDFVIVAEGDTLLICPKDRTQAVKQLLAKVESAPDGV